MGVKFQPFAVQGSAGDPTQFSDTFNRASGGLGVNWINGVIEFNGTLNPINTAQALIAVSTLDAAQCLTFTTIGAVNPATYFRGRLLAVPLINSCAGHNQFSQIQIVQQVLTAGAVNAVDMGCNVLSTIRGTTYSGYHLKIRANDYRMLLTKWVDNNPANSTNLIVGAPADFANGDTARLEATITSGQVALVVKKNGAVFASINDTAADRITTGSPGLFADELGNTLGETYASEWRNYSGGLL